MILVIGLSPAWQQICVLDDFRFGEVNRAREVHWCASGKGVNVAIALARLEVPHRLVSPLGGPVAASLRADCEALGVAAEWISTGSSTRVCTSLLDARSAKTTEIVENMPAISPAEQAEIWRQIERQGRDASLVVLTGSLPAETDPRFFAEVLQRLHKPSILDIRGLALKHALSYGPLIVKPNREELEQTVGHTLRTAEELVGAMHWLNQQGAHWAVVSDGGGPLYATSAGRAWRLIPPRVVVQNPIGSGDCLTAGLAAAFVQQMGLLEGLRWAVAAASDNATQLLPARIDRDRMAQLEPLVVLENL